MPVSVKVQLDSVVESPSDHDAVDNCNRIAETIQHQIERYPQVRDASLTLHCGTFIARPSEGIVDILIDGQINGEAVSVRNPIIDQGYQVLNARLAMKPGHFLVVMIAHAVTYSFRKSTVREDYLHQIRIGQVASFLEAVKHLTGDVRSAHVDAMRRVTKRMWFVYLVAALMFIGMQAYIFFGSPENPQVSHRADESAAGLAAGAIVIGLLFALFPAAGVWSFSMGCLADATFEQDPKAQSVMAMIGVKTSRGLRWTGWISGIALLFASTGFLYFLVSQIWKLPFELA